MWNSNRQRASSLKKWDLYLTLKIITKVIIRSQKYELLCTRVHLLGYKNVV